MPSAQNIMPQRRKIYAASQKQTRKKSKKWVQNQKLRQPHVEKAHPHVEKAHPHVEKAQRSFAVRSACFIVFFSMSFICLLANLFISPWKSVFFL